MKRLLAGSAAAILALPMLAAAAPPPAVSITLGPRHGHATPLRTGCAHTGGGNIDVTQPSPDIVVITMTGVAVATGQPCGNSVAAMNFNLEQCFEINFDDPKVKKAKLTVEGRVMGLLRSHCKGGGSAQVGEACASVGVGEVEVVSISLPAHAVAGGENLSVNDRQGPLIVPVDAGKYTLHQTFSVQASHPRALLPCKAASAEFAPDPALDPVWISYWEPFHGAAKKDFGFQITIIVAPDDTPEPDKKPDGKPASLSRR
jgi:hypothetical protein